MKMKGLILGIVVISTFVIYYISGSEGETVEDVQKVINVKPSDSIEVVAITTINVVEALTDDFSWNLIIADSGSINNFNGFATNYSKDPINILCFRGNNFRNSPSRGIIIGSPRKIELDYTFKTRKDTTKTRFGAWGGGSGWTGQPLVVRWDKEMKKKLGISNPTFLNNENALEVIVGSLSGDIYFFDFETGEPTRNYISIDGPIKGTPSIDPRLNGLLYVGQGIPKHDTLRFGSYIIDMTQDSVLYHQPGIDRDSYRKWGAFDSNPLIDIETATVFWPGENGLIYSFNTKDKNKPNLVSKLRYSNNRMFRYGVEASMAAVGQHGFFADNSGNILCVDLKNMTPKWINNNVDDTDASLMIDKEGDKYYVYVGNEVDIRGDTASANFRKLDASTGKEMWSFDWVCNGSKLHGKSNSGGLLASPVIGKKQAEGLVFCLFSRSNEHNDSHLVALNKYTGKEKYAYKLDRYSWASPIDFYNEEGELFLFFTDVSGGIYLMNGISGEIIYKDKMNFCFESSPIMIDDRIVVGVRGTNILSFKVICEK